MAYPDDFGDEPESVPMGGAGLGAVVGWLGALTSLTLIAGLGLWVWDLATRDATQVPVVRAMEGPARVAPDEPGGFEAAHKGYSVNSIASEADQPPLSERVVLAPEPNGPSEADVAASEAPAAPVDPQDAMRSAVEGALNEVLGIPTGDPGSDAAPSAAKPDPSSLIPRPDPRPEDDLVTRAPAAPSALAAAEGQQAPAPASMLSPEDIPPGTRLVQLGTFDTPDAAEAQWASLSDRFADYLAPRAKVVAPAEYGGAQVYRLRAHGFDDLADARAFCAVLLAEKADCIPVLTR